MEPLRQDKMSDAERALDALTDEERLEVMALYCQHCGYKPNFIPCQCMNDD